MRFAHPLVLMAGLALPWLWWIAARRRQVVSRARVAWRIATASLLVIAAAGVAVSTGAAPITVMAVLDRSASVPARSQQRALARINADAQTMRAGDRLGIVALGATAAVELRPTESPRIESPRTTVDETGTDIGAALRLARAGLPQDGSRRILLVSDGRETAGDAEREALLAGAAGVPVDVLAPMEPGGVRPLRVTRVVAPSDVRAGEPYRVSVEVAGTVGARGPIVLYRDDQVIGRQTVTIADNGTAGFVVSERQSQRRAFVYRAVAELEDVDDVTPSRGAVVIVEGKPSLLYVSAGAATLAPVLTAAGFGVSRVRPEQVPDTPQALSAFSGVVLDNVGSDQLTNATPEALATYVENTGGGLLLLGSSRTLNLGGYPATPLERILPIDLRPRSGQRAPAVDLVLVFDKSGSMADVSDGVPKIEVARQAVMRAVEVMPASDGIGVLAFDQSPTAVSPLTHNRDSAALLNALQRVVPGGSTAIAPAIETAFAWLRASGGVSGTRRQILLISDGRSADADSVRLRDLARSGGAEISIVAIGPNANRTLLEDVASASGGRAYFPGSLRELPREVAREAARSSGGGVVRERFVARVGSHPALSGVGLTSLPSLGGYVVGAAKPAASAILRSHLDDPVLAAWRAGLGRVAVYTADLGSPWSDELRAWRDGPRLWAQTVRWLSRRETDPAFQVAIRDADRGPRIEVEAVRPDGTFIELDEASAVVRTPAGADEDVPLVPTSPGRYQAPMSMSAEGPYVVAVSARETGTGIEHRLVRAIYWSADREGAAIGNDLAFLSRLSEISGGRVLSAEESPFEGPRPRGYRDASAAAAGMALVMFLLEIVAGGRLSEKRLRPQRRQPSTAVKKDVAA